MQWLEWNILDLINRPNTRLGALVRAPDPTQPAANAGDESE
jgi:hypothetical protein